MLHSGFYCLFFGGLDQKLQAQLTGHAQMVPHPSIGGIPEKGYATS